MKRFLRGTVYAVPLSGLALACILPVAEAAVLDEIVITAQKRSQSLQDVPVSVSAFSGDTLKDQGIYNPKDFNAKVPNVNMNFNTGEQLSVEVRGISSSFFTQNTDSPAGFYLDEVYIAARSAQFPQFFDLERVEVLRGPQGTLYGRNTTAGAFNFISRKPQGDVNGYVEVTAGRFGQMDVQAVAETPMSDKWSIRFAGQGRQSDGYGSNGDGGKINDRDDLAGRVSLRYQGDMLDATLRVFGNRSRNGGVYWKEGYSDPSGTNPLSAFFWDPTYVPDPDPHVVGANQQVNEVDNFGTTLSLDYDFNDVTLTSITSHLASENYMTHEFDGRPELLGRIDPFYSDMEQFSQEVRLTSQSSGPLKWIVGANYFESSVDVDNDYIIDGVSVGLGAYYPGLQIGDIVLDVLTFGEEKTTSSALFGDLSWRASDRVRLNLGLRYTWDEKSIDYSVINPLTVFTDPATIVVGGSTTAADLGLALTDLSGTAIRLVHEETWAEPTWKLGVDYDVTDDAMAYASYSHGYRSGGFNMGPWFETSEGLAFNPELIDSYELGIKSTWFDNRLRANLAAFYYEFEDIQISVPQAIGLTIANAGASEGRGFELDIEALPTDNWDVHFAAGYLDGEFTEFGDRSGEEFGQPKFTFNLYSEYRVPMENGELFGRGDLSYRSEERLGSNPAFFEFVESNYHLDLQVGYRHESPPFEIVAWTRNVTDEITRVVTDPVPPWMWQVAYSEPRTYGIRTKFYWGG